MKKIEPSFYLVFTSRSSALMSIETLNEILRKCYRTNKMANITGMLLYMEARFVNKLEGRFIQILEGDEAEVNSLYERICKDERHDNVFVLASGQQKVAHFDNWSMSYSGTVHAARGYNILDDKLFASRYFKKDKGPAHFLKSFYEYNLQLQKEYEMQVADFASNTSA